MYIFATEQFLKISQSLLQQNSSTLKAIKNFKLYLHLKCLLEKSHPYFHRGSGKNEKTTQLLWIISDYYYRIKNYRTYGERM
jgi:hypothetical protein